MPFASHAPRPQQLVAVEARRDVRRHGVEVRGERDAAAVARRPDVGASARDFLQGHVPSAGDEPVGDEVDRAAFGAGGGVDGEELGGERDDVGHRRAS